MQKSKEYGFTLIETITILAIVLVISSLSIPNSYLATDSWWLSEAASNLRTALEKNRNISLRTGSKTSLITSKSSFKTLDVHSNPIGAEHAFRHGVSVLGHDRQVIFYGSGAASPTSIELIRKNSKCQVVVSLRGRIRTTC